MNNKRQLILWIGALVVGAALGMLGLQWINAIADFIATIYTRLFRLLAVPTIALAVITTLASILPIYTIIDMIETAENVWSDSCVCAMTNRDC